MSDFCDSVSFVVLRSNPEWYFPDHAFRSKFLIKHSLFLNRGPNVEQVGVFGRSGEFVLTLNHRGKGPGEYLTIQDFGMDPEENKIWIIEHSGDRIHWYDLNGTWLETVKLPTHSSHVWILENGGMLVQNRRFGNPESRDTSRLYLVDRDGRFVRSLLYKPVNDLQYENFIDQNWIFQTGGQLYYRDLQYSDTLYKLNDAYKPVPYLITDLAKLRTDPDPARYNTSKPQGRDFLRIYDFFIFNDYLYLEGGKSMPFHLRVNRKTMETVCSERLTDDLSGTHGFFSNRTVTSDYLVQVIYPNYKENPGKLFLNDHPVYKELQDELRKTLAESMGEEDIILVYFKVKN